MTPVISVLMPVYNQQRYVGDAIKCVLDQTFKEFEFIIVDDGSTDRTVEIIERFDDKRIRLVREPHQGYVGALRRAMNLASGKWLARMDSDDICSPIRFERQMNFLAEHPECVFLTTAYGIVTPNDRYLVPQTSSKWFYVEPSDITLAKRLFCDPGTMFERKKAMIANYDDDLGSESPLWYRLLQHGKGVMLDEALYYVRWRMGSLSRGQFKNATTLHDQVRVKYDRANIKKIRKVSTRKLDLRNEKRTVYYCVAAGDMRAARKAAMGAWLRHPLSLETIKLIHAAVGFRRLSPVLGPCQVEFSPLQKPF